MSSSRWTMEGGDLIEGRYVIVREIGRGGMGAVYEAFDRKLERQVALKFLDPGLIEDAESVSRFQREALAAGRIGHESICDVRDRGVSEGGVPFIVMELLDGEPLQWIMVRERKLDPGRLGRLVLQALSALEAAHRAGIVHRDLKPENLFVSKSIEGLERIKILDFGISKFLSETVGKRLTRTGTVMGSPLYMSPEQAAGSKDIDHRTDIWSMGVIMYEGLTGKEPFDGENYNQIMLSIITRTPAEPRVLVPEIPEPIEEVVLTAMEKDRDERYTTAAQFADALRAALEDAGEEPSLVVTVPAATPSRAPKPPAETKPAPREPSLDPLGETIPADRTRSRRGLSMVVIGLLALVAVGAAIVALSSAGTAPSGQPTDGPHPAPAIAEDTTEPAAPEIRSDETPLPTKAPHPVTVEVRGLPEGARLTFDGAPVDGTTLEGTAGRQGVLEVASAGREPVRIDLTIEEGRVVDLTDRFQPSVTAEAPADEAPAPEARPEDQQDERGRRHSRRDSSRERETRDRRGPETPTPGAEAAIKGRHGSPVFTDYPGTD